MTGTVETYTMKFKNITELVIVAEENLKALAEMHLTETEQQEFYAQMADAASNLEYDLKRWSNK